MHIVSTAPSPLVVTFRLAGEEFALPAEDVRDAWTNPVPRRVPGAHAWFDGIVPWRGQFIPVLNVARRLGLSAGEGHAVFVIDLDGEAVALRVDGLIEEAPVRLEALEPVGTGALVGFSKGHGQLADRRVVLLDIAALLAPPAGTVSTFVAKAERPNGRLASQTAPASQAGPGQRGAKRA